MFLLQQSAFTVYEQRLLHELSTNTVQMRLLPEKICADPATASYL